MNKLVLSILAVSFFSISCPAQINSGKGKYPFPQNIKYLYGIKPSQANYNDALNSYNDWKRLFLLPSNTTPQRYGVNYNGVGTTVSEGIGYGMLLSAYANDSVTFNGLWRYYKYYMNGSGVMNWQINAKGQITGFNGATDADEDAAMGLVIASCQWPSTGGINYYNDATTLIKNIRKSEVDTAVYVSGPGDTTTYILKPGDAFGGGSEVDISYFCPAYYRIFAQFTGDTSWLKVVESCYKIISENANPTTGLVSDWAVGSTGAPYNTGYDAYSEDFYFDAIRTPWRLAVDYLWFGDTRAQLYCTKMANFVSSIGGVGSVSNGYTLSGAPIGGAGTGTFKGPLCVAGMVSSVFDNYLFNGYYANLSSNENGSNDYFGHSLQSLAFFVLTGNFYPLPTPVCSKPDLGPNRSLCNSNSITLNPNMSSANRQFKWNTGQTTNTLTVNQKGLYILTVDSGDCQSSDSVYISGLKVELGNEINITLGNSVTLSAGTSGPGVQYYWRYNSLTAAPFDSAHETVTVALPGKYYITVDSGGCVSTDSVAIEGNGFLLYPNPNNGVFTIEPFYSTPQNITVSIYGISNGILKTVMADQQYSLSGSSQKIVFNFTGQAQGMYLAQVNIAGKLYTKKFIIIY